MKKEQKRADAYYTRGVCYCCEKQYEVPHHFYKEMCKNCGDLNYQKRNQKTDLTGYKALVTGGRIKIGFETSRLLLEMGAEVIVTTRFPKNAYSRYEQLESFPAFKDRLKIIGVDLRSLLSISQLLEYLKGEPLDILVNNAAQTVRRPVPFYKHLLAEEQGNLAIGDAITPETHSIEKRNIFLPSLQDKNINSVSLSQIKLLPEDYEDNSKIFPIGKLDKDGQQVDLRENNSWMYQLEEIPIVELCEVLQINLVAPFILTQQLMPLMANPNRRSYIINVSSMEGNFNSPRKNSRHVHTNMAKAGLNMLTITASTHYKDYNIFMNSVDTGWITNEKPNPEALTDAERKSIMAIDEIDGAIRILDPILQGIQGKATYYGKLFKNYKEYPW